MNSLSTFDEVYQSRHNVLPAANQAKINSETTR